MFLSLVARIRAQTLAILDVNIYNVSHEWFFQFLFIYLALDENTTQHHHTVTNYRLIYWKHISTGNSTISQQHLSVNGNNTYHGIQSSAVRPIFFHEIFLRNSLAPIFDLPITQTVNLLLELVKKTSFFSLRQLAAHTGVLTLWPVVYWVDTTPPPAATVFHDQAPH